MTQQQQQPASPQQQRCVVCTSNRTPLEKCDHGNSVTVLGEGTYGLVYLCCNTTTGTSFVEKVLKLDASVTHLREVQCLKACKHPNVVRLLSTSNAVSGRVTVRMEHCQGGDLFSLIQNRRKHAEYFSNSEIVALITQLLLAVHFLHSQGVLHRDIKTRNVFLCNEDQRSGGASSSTSTSSSLRLKLGDFGCSVQSDLSIAEDQRRTLCGTYASFAPEMLRVDQDHRAQYGKKAETWSVGVVLYELLSLVPPFTWNQDQTSTFYDMTQRIVTGIYPPLSDAPLGPNSDPHYTHELVQLCYDMLTVDLEKRPSVRTLLMTPFIKAEALRYVAELRDPEERGVLQKQLDSLTEPVSFVFRGTCLRVRSSTAEVVDAEIRLASTGTVQFRDIGGKSTKDWSAAQLSDCVLEKDEFEESDGRQFYGICLRPSKLTPVTFGYYDEANRDVLSDQLRQLKALHSQRR